MVDDSDQQTPDTGEFPRVRREPRIASAIVIEVSGFDEIGRFFSEHTATQNVSAHGCCFRLKARISPDALLTLQALGGERCLPARPAFYQVVWIERIGASALVGAYRLGSEDTSNAASGVPDDSHSPES